MKKQIAAAVFSVLALNAMAADYYLVVPFKHKASSPATPTAPQPAPIQVSLNAYTLPTAMENIAYDGFDLNTLLMVTGDANYTGTGSTWRVANGALPNGISLSADGVLSGTPTTAGTMTFTLEAAYKTKSGTQTYQLVVANLTVALSGATLTNGVVGQSYTGYDFKTRLSSNAPDFDATKATWSIASGALPPGMSLSPTTGVLSGTPTTSGSFSFDVKATYQAKDGLRTYQVSVLDLNVLSLLHADGANNSTSIADANGNSWSAQGGAVVSTTQSKFGGASFYFPGSINNAIVGPAISLPGDFTIEAWVYPTNNSGIHDILGQWRQGTAASNWGYVLYTNNGQPGFLHGGAAAANQPYSFGSASALPLNTWSHLAVTRLSNTMRMFVNGTQVATLSVSAAGATLPIPTIIGTLQNDSGTVGYPNYTRQTFAGYVDEVRISNASRYNSNFTAPTQPYPAP